jgi:methylthioribose-1-phosphate isomerase
MRTVFWEDNALRLIDQRMLPSSLEIVSLFTYQEVADAIKSMMVRGAPAIGAAAAFGMALAAQQISTRYSVDFRKTLEEAGDLLKHSRPTAINLAWAVNRILEKVSCSKSPVEVLQELVLSEAQKIAEEDVCANKKMGELGAALIQDGDTIIHHCNTGSLAVVEWGTALGVIRTAHEQGKKIHVLVDETRPRLQGARLTAWELLQYGIPFEVITDNMAGYFLQTRKANKVFFGADRIAANGDVVNKIGSYMLALAAFDNAIPVYVVAPFSSVDFALSSGSQIPIEERDPEEVLGLQFNGEQIFPKGTTARNPAFDFTPNRLITAIVTENGIVRPPFRQNLALSRKENHTKSPR